MREVSELLSAWNGFYTMIGSSAAALTGLIFVVITLISDDQRGASEDGISTFSSPTVVHFGGALFTAAVMLMPFRALAPVAIILGLEGLCGLVLVTRIALRTWNLSGSYRPDMEDWMWHVILPFAAYAAFAAGALALHAARRASALRARVSCDAPDFIGIHNAWDVVTFLATGKAQALPDTPGENAKSKRD